jgi:hypothetical protein
MTAWMPHAQFQQKHNYDEEPCSGTLRIVEQDGPTWIVECDGCDYTAGLPAKDASPQFRVKMRSDRAGFPAMFAGKPFEESIANAPVKARIREWISDFREAPIPAPSIYGLNGRGKSHLLVATCEQLIGRYNSSVWFRPIASLLDDLQDSFSDDREHRRIWERATTVDVLALDDVGAEQATDWRQERLARLVDERYQNNRPVLLATNFPPAAWEAMLGARTVSRLLGMTFQVELQGSDRRVSRTREGALT